METPKKLRTHSAIEYQFILNNIQYKHRFLLMLASHSYIDYTDNKKVITIYY